MVKSKEVAERRMRERVSTAAPYLVEGFDEATDPLDVLLKDPEGYTKAMVAGLTEAIRKGQVKIGWEKAKERNAWKGSKERAGRHYEERVDEMVKHAMEDYDVRAKCIEEAKKGIADMPKATRAQKIARSAKYQELMGACMDRAKGRK